MTITLRANLKALRIRPAREPGDKPVLEVVLRTEVDPRSFYLAAKAGKDMTVEFIPDPDMQPSLPLDEPERGAERVTTVEPDGIVASTERVDEAEHARRNQQTADELLAAASPTTNGVDHESPGWHSGLIGTGEIEQQRRRRRGSRSSETVPAT